jgi:acyl carrier protein
MTEAEFRAELDRILEFEPGTLKGNEKMSDLSGWDSLAIMGVIAIADLKLGKTMPASELAACKTIAELTAIVVGNARTT